MGVRHWSTVEVLDRPTQFTPRASSTVAWCALVAVFLAGMRGLMYRVRLQFGDGLLQLRDGRRDIGQLDHIRPRRRHQTPQFRQIIRLALRFGQMFGKGRDDPPRQRDILGPHRNPRRRRKGLDDRQKRGRGQLRCLIHLGVDDVGCGICGHESLSFASCGQGPRHTGAKPPCPPPILAAPQDKQKPQPCPPARQPAAVRQP